MEKSVFYHAGCPVCVSAEQAVLDLVDRSRYDIELVHLGETPARIPEAQKAGVASVPALVMHSGQVLHINHGADLAALTK